MATSKRRRSANRSGGSMEGSSGGGGQQSGGVRMRGESARALADASIRGKVAVSAEAASKA